MADWGDQEQLSLAHVTAIVASAGYACRPADRWLDNTGVDLDVFPRHPVPGLGYPHLYLQVKSKQVAAPGEGSAIPVNLTPKQYEDLRGVLWPPYRILIVVEQPRRREEWLNQTHHRTTIRHCAYWISLMGHSALGTKNRRILIPREQVFEPRVLQGIMNRVIEGRGIDDLQSRGGSRSGN